jgi:hypothetical protein
LKHQPSKVPTRTTESKEFWNMKVNYIFSKRGKV